MNSKMISTSPRWPNPPSPLTKGLKYKAWVVGGPITPGIAIGGVVNQLPLNCALTGADTQLTNGTPTITIATPYKSFSILNFFFGCSGRTDEETVNTALQ